jgi:glycerol-3-phosphate dehydrogenase (NAD(P)+)
MSRVGIIGAGAWGTALACAARRAGSDVLLWAHEAETVASINERHENPTFLPGVALDPAIGATDDLARAGACDLVLLVAPSAHLGAVSAALAPDLPSATPVCVCTKGIEVRSGRLMTEVAGAALGRDDLACLSGPSFAAEVAAALPTAVTAAGPPDAVEAVAGALGGPAFRIYRSDDVAGVEIGGAVKNVIAIACGIADGRGMGLNARAALISRGLAEMVRLAEAAGGRRETQMGLSGLGDLVLTCTGTLSRNYTFGKGLGSGETMEALMAGRASVVEGAVTAPALAELAARLNVDMPIATAVNDVLAGRNDVASAIAGLLARRPGEEF